MRRKNTGYYDDWYSVPSGHGEPGELPIDCLLRETEEEVGLKLEKEYANHAHTMYRTQHDETGDRADYFFTVTGWKGEPSICEPHKCDEVGWFPLDALPENTMHHVREAIEYIEKGVAYSELGLNRVVKNPSA